MGDWYGFAVLIVFFVVCALWPVAKRWWQARQFRRHHERPPVESWSQRYEDANRSSTQALRDGETMYDTFRREYRRRQ